MISDVTVAALVSNLADLRRRQEQAFAVVLHGGEPLLIGAKRLGVIFEQLRSVLDEIIPISIQTNGTLISQAILDLCSLHRISISVSIDGPQFTNDKYRITATGSSLFSKTLDGISLLRNHPDWQFLFAGTLSVVDPQSDPVEVYQFLKDIGSPSADFLFKDGNHDRLPDGKISFVTTEYGEWLTRLWDYYIADPLPVPIRILDDTAKLLLGSKSRKEGIGENTFSIVIIDTDGTISKNDTLKSSFEGADRFESEWNVATHNLADVICQTEYSEYVQSQRTTASECLDCELLSICGGGMPLYRYSSEAGYSNRSIYCEDHKRVIRHVGMSLAVSQSPTR